MERQPFPLQEERKPRWGWHSTFARTKASLYEEKEVAWGGPWGESGWLTSFGLWVFIDFFHKLKPSRTLWGSWATEAFRTVANQGREGKGCRDKGGVAKKP